MPLDGKKQSQERRSCAGVGGCLSLDPIREKTPFLIPGVSPQTLPEESERLGKAGR